MNIPFSQYLDLLRTYLRPQRGRVALLALLLFGGIGLQLIGPQIIRYFIDSAQNSTPANGAAQAALWWAALLFLAVVLLERAVRVGTVYLSEHVAWSATNGLRSDLTRHVLGLDMAFHNEHTPGELLERLDGDVDRLANFFSQFVLQILGGALLTGGVLALLYREDWRMGAVLTLFVLAYMVVHTRGQQMAVPLWRRERQYSAELSGFVEERLGGVRDIQTSGAVAETLRRFYGVMRRRLWQTLRADVVTDLAWSVSKIFYELGTVAAMALGAWAFYRGGLTVGAVYLTIHYLTMLNEPLNRIARQLEDLQRVRVAVERTTELRETEASVADGPGAVLPAGALSVRFAGVDFAYRAGTPVLHGMSFELPAGQVLGVLGRTGSGKTTLSRLLFRLYDPDRGHIELSGVDVRQPRRNQLRERVGLVTQEVQLFNASLRDNLALFDESIADARIWQGLAALGLDEWVRGMENGLDTVLHTERALSAGEAQLLALARVFLKDPGLVILDEASSRLDPATERLLTAAMERLLAGRTAILIAHRLETIRSADQILVLEGGRIQEYGAQHELRARPDSLFSKLLRTGMEPESASAPDAPEGVPA